MAAGSIAGSLIGGAPVGVVPEEVLIPVLSLILIISAWKVWRHQATQPEREQPNAKT